MKRARLRNILELSFAWAQVRFRLRNEGSFIGIFWYLLEPLLTFMILLLYGRVLFQDIIPRYPLYLLTGIVVFNFFLAVTNFSVTAITSNANFIQSMSVVKEPFVLSGLIQFAFSHACEMLLLFLLALYLKVSVIGFLIYPVLFLFFCLFVLGCSFLFATIGVYVSDFLNVWHVLGRLLWLATPIFYTPQNSSLLRFVNQINPLYYFINAARDIIVYGRMPSMGSIFFIIAASFTMLAVGFVCFASKKSEFASRL